MFTILLSAACSSSSHTANGGPNRTTTAPSSTPQTPTTSLPPSSVQGSTGPQPSGLSFVDTRRGWALVSVCAPGCAAGVDVSVDGGASWRRLPATLPGEGTEIRFLDALDGYVLVTSAGSASAAPANSLFVTHDGGGSWQGSHPPRSPQWIEPGRSDDWALAGDCSQDGTTCQVELDSSTDHGRT